MGVLCFCSLFLQYSDNIDNCMTYF
jgi:hypothetical protein